MITKPEPAHTLFPALLLVACTVLPAGTAAQNPPPPPTETSALSASISEALRSPFHTSTVPGLAFLGPVPVPGAGYQEVQAAANDPSFLKVFWPTLATTVVSELLFIYGALCADPDSGGCADGWGALWPVMGTTTVFLGPASAAKLAGGSFPMALIGSALGAGINWAILQGPEIKAMVPVFPVLQAGLTTLLSLKRL